MKTPALIFLLLLTLCACVAPPEYIDPRTLPITLGFSERVVTHEADRYVCEQRGVLICEPVGAARVRGAARECVCTL